MGIDQTKKRTHARALLTGGALLAAIAVLLLAIALLSEAVGGPPDKLTAYIANEVGMTPSMWLTREKR